MAKYLRCCSRLGILLALISYYYVRLGLIRCSDSKSDRILRRTARDNSSFVKASSMAMQLTHDRLELLSYDGLKLRALYFPADCPTDNCVICVHGYRSGALRDHAASLQEYHKRGFNVLLPDGRAHGESEGRYIGFGWLDRFDILAWCEKLRELMPDCRILLHGVSMGAAGVICAAGEYCSGLEGVIRGVIADSSYTSGYEQFRHVTVHYLHVPVFPLLETTGLLAKLICGCNLKKCSPISSITAVRVPILLIHGGADDFVPTEMSRRLYNACSGDKELIVIDGASHAAGYSVNPIRFTRHVDVFLDRIGMSHGISQSSQIQNKIGAV